MRGARKRLGQWGEELAAARLEERGYVVRERNAHAWVEAWLPGAGWETFDPTPPSAIARQMPEETPLWGALGDLLAHSAARALAWIAAWGALRLTVGVAVAIALWVIIRSLMRRRARRRWRCRRTLAGWT